MDFCEELALLQSSMLLAEKQFSASGGLCLMTKAECKSHVAVKIIQSAIDEITAGLPIQGHSEGHWEIKLPYLLFNSLLHHEYSGELDMQRAVCENYFGIFIAAFPPFSKHLFFHLVKTNRWNDVLIEMLECADSNTATLIVADILRHVSTEPDSDDVHLLLDIGQMIGLQPLGLVDLFGNHSFGDSVDNKPSVLLLLEAGLAAVTTDLYSEGVIPLALGIMNIINLMWNKKCLSKRTSSAEDKNNTNINSDNRLQMALQSHINDKQNRTVITEVIPCPEFCQIKRETTQVESDNGDLYIRVADPLVRSLHGLVSRNDTLTTKLVSFLSSDKDLDDLLGKRHSVEWLSAYHAIFQQFCKSLNSVTGKLDEHNKNVPLLTELTVLNNSFNQINESLRSSYGSVEMKMTRIHLKDEFFLALERIDSKPLESSDAFDWLLSSPTVKQQHIHDDRWINCVKKNKCCIKSLEVIIKVIDMLIFTKDSSVSAVYHELKEVALQSVGNLPLGKLNELLSYVLYSQNLKKIFEEDVHTQTNLTAVFNRLTDAKEDFRLVASGVTSAALQCPEEVVSKSVIEAVTRAGQMSLIAKIWKTLPSVCQLTCQDNSSLSLLVKAIHEMATNKNLTRKEENNFMDFLTLMLKDDGTNSPQPLDHVDLTRHCVLPYLNANLVNTQSSSVSLSTCLKILLKVLTITSDYNKQRLLDGIHPLPIILCLCEIIDECRLLWDASDHSDKKDILKTMAVQSVEILVSVVDASQVKDDDKAGVSWLLKKLRSLHWTSRLYVLPLLTASAAVHSYTQLIPKEIRCLMKSEAGLGFKETPTHIVLQMLMEGASVNDSIMQQLLQDLDPGKLPNEEDHYPQLLVALVQVFPVCILEAWQRLCSFLQKLISDNHINVPYRSTFCASQQLSALTEVRVQLCMTQLLFDVLMLINKTQAEVNQAQWRHLGKCTINSLKPLCPLNSPTMTTADHFLLQQILCHVTYLVSCLPSSASDQMVVMAMDLGSRFTATWEHAKMGHRHEELRTVRSLVNRWPPSKEKESLLSELCKCRQEENTDLKQSA